jgi:paraquat-inducible protein B
LLMISAVILGCYAGDLNLKIRFAQTEGLRADDRIFFEKNHIGKVDAISYSEGGDYIAEVKIDKGFKKAVTENSRFFIIDDPSGKGRKAIKMVKVEEGGVPLVKGAVIEGSTRFSLLLGQMEEDFGKAMSELGRKINKLSDEVKQLPESEEIKSLEHYLNQLKEKLKKAGSAFREKVQKELLPRLQKEIEKLKERLRKLGREKEVEPLEVKMEELRKI